MRLGVAKMDWSNWFAWRPVHCIDGRWLWLEWCERTNYFNPDVEVRVPFGLFTNTVYRPLSTPERGD